MNTSRELSQTASGASLPVHTPGPWQIADDYTRDGSFKIIGDVDGEYFTDSAAPVMSCEFVATLVDEYDETHDRTKANRRLILAAPDLLEALGELVDLVEAIRDGSYVADSFTTQPGRAAIAKATGAA